MYGHNFSVLTDNNPLTYILTRAKLDATGHCWLEALATFDFDIKYRPGVINVNADGLSRLPAHVNYCTNSGEIEEETTKAICGSSIDNPLVETICLSTRALEHVIDVIDHIVEPRDWRQAQRNDPFIGPIIKLVQEGVPPTPRCSLPSYKR